jgi:hypothetical protein
VCALDTLSSADSSHSSLLPYQLDSLHEHTQDLVEEATVDAYTNLLDEADDDKVTLDDFMDFRKEMLSKVRDLEDEVTTLRLKLAKEKKRVISRR